MTTHHRDVLVAPTKAAGNIFLNELSSHTLVASKAGGTSISRSFLNGSLSFRTAVVVVAIPEALSVGRVDASLIIETVKIIYVEKIQLGDNEHYWEN